MIRILGPVVIIAVAVLAYFTWRYIVDASGERKARLDAARKQAEAETSRKAQLVLRKEQLLSESNSFIVQADSQNTPLSRGLIEARLELDKATSMAHLELSLERLEAELAQAKRKRLEK